MRYIAAVVLTLCSMIVSAEDWSRADKGRQLAVGALQFIDCAQTRYAMKHGSFKEQNPVLGSHPSLGRINNICAAAIVGHVFVSNALSPGWRAGFQYATIAIEGWVVIDHHRMGVTLGVLF